jgi:hypothetical protein
LPTKRHFRGRHRREQFSADKAAHLKYGQDFFGGGYGPENPDRTAMQRDWRLHKAKILSDWLAERPGSRPWAFSEFEDLAGEPRRIGSAGNRIQPSLLNRRATRR